MSTSVSKKKKKQRRPQDIGLAPGTLLIDPDAAALHIHLVRYGPDHLEELDLTGTDELDQILNHPATRRFPMYWIDIIGHGSVDQLNELGRILRLHPLALEDIVNSYQRPKVDLYDGDFFIVARMIDESVPLETRLDSEQLVLLVRPGLVATFQEKRGDCFDPVRKRLRAGNTRIRGNGADYLTYAILDSLVDRYLVLADHYREILENLEDQLLAQESAPNIDRLYHVRRDLIHLGRAAAPMRDVIMGLLRTDDPTRIRPETELFLRDCYDHALRVVDWIDSHRDFAASLMEVHLSLVGNRTNEAMKVLTIISTIFIPLSFIAGLYGMNFHGGDDAPFNMPELHWKYGYPLVLTAMALIGAGIYWFIRRKRWL